MQFLIDHITSIVIGAVLILIVAGVQLRGQNSSVDATQYSAAKTRLLDLAQMMERDFSNIGAGVSTAAMASAIQTFDTLSSTRVFAFYGRVDQADPDSHLIRYEWVPTDSVTLKNSQVVTTYQITRLVDGAYTASSLPTVTQVRIDLMDADSNAVGGMYSNTRFVSVDITAVSPLGVGDEIEQPRWQRIFRPANLTRF